MPGTQEGPRMLVLMLTTTPLCFVSVCAQHPYHPTEQALDSPRLQHPHPSLPTRSEVTGPDPAGLQLIVPFNKIFVLLFLDTHDYLFCSLANICGYMF